MKEQRTITIDADVNRELKRDPTRNVSALCNKLLRQWIEENKVK